MKKVVDSVLLLILVLQVHFGQAQVSPSALIDSLEVVFAEKHIPGAMISVVRADTVLLARGIGYANIENQEKVTGQHLFRLGSISKSITAMAMVKLMRDKGLALDTPLRELSDQIPFNNPWEETSPVTVANLLEHTSGFEDFHLHAIYNTRDSSMPPVAQMVQDHRQSLHARWRPGTKKAYSNPNYIVVGQLIEELQGLSFAQYVKDSLLVPMGMPMSGFYYRQPDNLPFAKPYRRNGRDLIAIDFTKINGTPAGEFCSSAVEMSAYLQLLLRRDTTFFSADEYERIETATTSLAAQKGLGIGYGLGNYSIWKNGFVFHGHGGEIDGYASRYVYAREADLGVAISVNRNADVNAMLDEVLELLLGRYQPSSQQRNIKSIDLEDQKLFSGFYEFKSPKSELIGFTDRMFAGLSLDIKDDYIQTKTILGRIKDTLYHAGNLQFYYNEETAPSIQLFKHNGKPAMWINDHYTEQESRVKRLIIFFGLLCSVLLLFGVFIFLIIDLLRRLFKGKGKKLVSHYLMIGAVLGVVLLLLGFGLTVSDPASATEMNASALLMYISSYAFVFLSLLTCTQWAKLPFRSIGKLFYRISSVGAVALVIYLWHIGFIGLKLWSY